MKHIPIGLSGSSGKMGRTLKGLLKTGVFPFVLKAQSPPKENFKKWPISLKGVVDFSSPYLWDKTLAWCVKNQIPLVSGTTGLSSLQKRKLKNSALKIPVFYEENFSYGIWQMKKWMADLIPPASKEMFLVDLHHRDKKDAPSGTALKLKGALSPSLQKKLHVFSDRKGREFGTHALILKAPEEVLIIQHRALNRKLFARKALEVLKWLIPKKNGLYRADDFFKKTL